MTAPTPWTIDSQEVTGIGRYVIRDANGWSVAIVTGMNGEVADPRAERAARMMVAAPELVGALNEILLTLEEHGTLGAAHDDLLAHGFATLRKAGALD